MSQSQAETSLRTLILIMRQLQFAESDDQIAAAADTAESLTTTWLESHGVSDDEPDASDAPDGSGAENDA